MWPSDRVAQLYPQAPGSLFIDFYDLQGYSGGILTCLHMENNVSIFTVIEKTKEAPSKKRVTVLLQDGCLTLNLEAVSFSKVSVIFLQARKHLIPEDTH
jgi:hypothetical protein